MTIHLTLNGTSHSLAASMNITELLAELGLDPRLIAVELNATIVPKSAYDQTTPNDGDVIEIVRFVGGG